MVHVLALEPYYGGSHRAFLDGWAAQSRHQVERLTMPARKWKWRMRGSAMTMGEQVRERAGEFDCMFASDFVDLAALVGLQADVLAGVPKAVYFHENQITYPVPEWAERDYQFGFTNITTCLAADRVLFNSRFHMDSFLDGAAELLGRMPDCVPDWAPERIRERSGVVHVGVDLESIDAARGSAGPREGPLTVLWNHRWEYDKGVEEFFELMFELAEEGHEFRLAATGQSFTQPPPVHDRARRVLGDRLSHFGYVESRADYVRLLCECDVVVSTARHEFFGIAVVEAVYAGCLPLLPQALSYPELLPERCHELCLYRDRRELKRRLVRYMQNPGEARRVDVSDAMSRFGWPRVAPLLDSAVEAVCRRAPDD